MENKGNLVNKLKDKIETNEDVKESDKDDDYFELPEPDMGDHMKRNTDKYSLRRIKLKEEG